MSEGCSLLLHVAARRFIFYVMRSPFFSSRKFILVADVVFIFLLWLFGLALASDSAVTAHKFIGCARHRRRYFKILRCRLSSGCERHAVLALCSVHNVLSASVYVSVNFCSVSAIYTHHRQRHRLYTLKGSQDCERDSRANERIV